MDNEKAWEKFSKTLIINKRKRVSLSVCPNLLNLNFSDFTLFERLKIIWDVLMYNAVYIHGHRISVKTTKTDNPFVDKLSPH